MKNKRFNRCLVVNDKIFEHSDVNVQELLEKDDSILADNPFVLTTSLAICRMSKAYGFNPAFLTLILLCNTDHLKKEETHSSEEIAEAIGLPRVRGFEQKLDMISRLIYKLVMTRKHVVGNKTVKVMDDVEFTVKNYATFTLYNMLPWIGRKNFKVYKREVDEEGNIIKVWSELEKRTPFGVYLFRKIAIKLGLEDLLV